MSRSLTRVYPRSRGGTRCKILQIRELQGLSPLARGNRIEAQTPKYDAGSIPAPRGGTYLAKDLCGEEPGLSPLARGNPYMIRD